MNKKISLTILGVALAIGSYAANKDRTGQGSASELLLNPWARSGGLFGLNCANVSGPEAMKLNIAGLSKTKGTEVALAHTRYLAGTGMSISNIALGQDLGEIGVLGVNIMSFSFGEIPITTTSSPTGGIGNYKPSFLNLSLGLGHTFSKTMSAGFNATFVNEAIDNIKANAIGFDAGVQYVNGKRDNLHLGISLRNVGTNLRFSGDGFDFNGTSPDLSTEITVKQRSEKFALPSQLSIGVAYDFYLDENKTVAGEGEEAKKDAMPKHRLSPTFSFISNAFINDWVGIGAEYAYKEKFMLRAAYRYENSITNKDETTTFYTGFSAGAGFQTQIAERSVALEYGFKMTNISSGVHTLGLRAMLGSNKDDE